MSYYWNKPDICRWCGTTLPRDHIGQWCTSAHKQAHHRAYKKYVTNLSDREKRPCRSKPGTRKPSNARKKKKVR